MGYNIDSEKTPVLDAWMYAKDIVKLHKKHEADIPEGNFLSELVNGATDLLTEGLPDAKVPLKHFWWHSEWSGSSYEDVLKSQIVPFIHGKVEVIFTWEGGDSVTAFAVDDGVLTECDVEMVLKRKTP